MKKIIASLFALTLTPSVLANEASAGSWQFPRVLTDLINTVFGSGITPAFQRVLLFLLFFTIFYALLERTTVFKRGQDGVKKNISLIMALILGLISSIAIEANLLNRIYQIWGGLGGFILLVALPIFLVFFVYKYMVGDNVGTHFGRFLILVIVGTLLMSPGLFAGIQVIENEILSQWVALGGLIILIIGIIELFKMFGKMSANDVDNPNSGSGESTWGEKLSNYASDYSDKRRERAEIKKQANEREEEKKIKEKKDKDELLRKAVSCFPLSAGLSFPEAHEIVRRGINRIRRDYVDVLHNEDFIRALYSIANVLEDLARGEIGYVNSKSSILGSADTSRIVSKLNTIKTVYDDIKTICSYPSSVNIPNLASKLNLIRDNVCKYERDSRL